MPRKINIDGDKIRSMVEEGKSFPTIMKEMKCSRSTLSRALKELRLKAIDGRSERYHKTKTRKLPPEKIKTIKTHVKALGLKYSGANPETANIIATIDMQIEHHQTMIGKLTQAKQILI